MEDKVQIEFLEKHMPSFIPFWAKGNQKMRQKKEIKHKLFAFIYQNNNKNIKGKSITNLCKILGNLSRDKYAKWCKKWNLNIDGTSTLPKYEPNALEMILECKKSYGQCSAIEIHRQIIQEFKKSVSVKVIERLKLENAHLFVSLSRKNQKHNQSGKYTLAKNVRDDLITNDMFIERPGQIIGMDGTHFNKHKIANEKVDSVLEVGYDWFTKETVAYQWNSTENSETVLKTVEKINNYLEKNLYKNSIVQCDRGAANCSQLVKDYENSQNNFVISMSNVGFKHNPCTESLNGWLKDGFYATFGYSFETWNEFYEKVDLYVKMRNKMLNLKYNKKRRQQLHL